MAQTPAIRRHMRFARKPLFALLAFLALGIGVLSGVGRNDSSPRSPAPFDPAGGVNAATFAERFACRPRLDHGARRVNLPFAPPLAEMFPAWEEGFPRDARRVPGEASSFLATGRDGFSAPNRTPAPPPGLAVFPPSRSTAAAAGTDMPFIPPSSGFTLTKLGSAAGPTLLVIGGIQGDEPGGFSAASLLASHYSISSGSVWVVPGLNFPSILQRSRGLFGDMNRKFASLAPSDPEYDSIMQIKSILLDERVTLVLNLHDGSGFYRPTWEDALRNPKRWGQSVIIDQETLQAPRFHDLYGTARRVEEAVNHALLDPKHRYHIYNTFTAAGNTEMAKTLSWFAVCNGKPAFGIEASKEFATEYRAYYHLQTIEAFMREMGIMFERDFPLTPKGIMAALNSNLKVAAYDNRLILHLDNTRPTLNMIPFKKGMEPDVRASKPLLALVPDQKGQSWRVAYGNRTLTRLNPQFMDFDDSLDAVDILLDGTPHTVRFGDVVTVSDSFLVRDTPGYRVNAIGAQKEKNGTEADILLKKNDFMPRFSVDQNATTYRVEVYKDKAFAGMILVRFGENAPVQDEPLTATGGPESAFGF